jgi:hypothetical protein
MKTTMFGNFARMPGSSSWKNLSLPNIAVALTLLKRQVGEWCGDMFDEALGDVLGEALGDITNGCGASRRNTEASDAERKRGDAKGCSASAKEAMALQPSELRLD